MVIKTWRNFKKDKNSTKVPLDTDANEYNITLKEDTDLLNPVFYLKWDNVPDFNYLQYIIAYYFVDDYVMRSNSVYEVHCSMDVLASYRGDILGSTQYVLRSTSSYNANLYDNVYEPELNPTITMTQTQSPLSGEGTYIIKYSSSTSPRFGVSYRCGSATEVGSFIAGCYDLNNWDQFLQTGLEALQKTVFDFSQYLQEIYWLPINQADIPNQSSVIPFVGAWQITSGDAGTKLFFGEYVVKLAVTINTPSRYYNDFRDYSNSYTRFILDIPCLGSIDLDAKDVYKGLQVQFEIDLKTGDAKHVISTSDAIITTVRGNYKSPVSYATFNNNFVTGANQILNSISQIGSGVASATGGNYGGTVSGVSSGVTSLTEGLVALDNITSHQISSQGTQGDIKSNDKYSLTRYVYNCAEQPIFNIGRKLNEHKQLSTLSGYCQCANAKLDTSAYGTIKDELLSHLNNGFYIE